MISVCVLAEVVRVRVVELFRRGAGMGQGSAQTALMNHHVQQGAGLSHLHHRVQRPHSQVGTVLQRLARPNDTPLEHFHLNLKKFSTEKNIYE